jgi:hypothetical protein
VREVCIINSGIAKVAKNTLGGGTMKKFLALVLCLAFLTAVCGCGKPETPQEKFQNMVKAKIEHIQQKLDALKAKFNKELGALEQQKDAAAKELTELEKATGEAWEKAKDKMSESLEKMEKGYERMQEHFK